MNIKQMKSMISKFRSADVSMIKDADMRAKAQKLQNKQGGFTLLELLVVVAILAIIAGAVISSLDGQEELAAQKTTVHTMAAMEEAFQVYRVSEKRLIPGDLESLMCVEGIDATDGEFTLVAADIVNPQLLGDAGSFSNIPRVNGGLTADLAESLIIADITASGAISAMEDAGFNSIRYAHNGVCDSAAMFDTTGGFDANVDAVATVEIVKPSLVFRSPVVEDDEWEFGAGASVNVTDPGVTIPVAFYSEPAELGLEEDAVVAVFGIGPDSGIIGDYIARAPSDGNTGPDKYAHFSVAYQIGECSTADD
ncbi:type II secretion system protein, partial [Methylophaga sp. UBA3996]